MTKASNETLGSQKTSGMPTKSNKSWFRKVKSEKRGKETN